MCSLIYVDCVRSHAWLFIAEQHKINDFEQGNINRFKTDWGLRL